ncbi:BTAD domain-containing putative transcriptional regulator [Streptomyces sp. NPDC048428]|uniref:bacterial transcriptional activator domain-containing protein n=1 Tax=Streptomyces sp. NPDC048428 TaxID=3154503 RepID=UPI00341D8D94
MSLHAARHALEPDLAPRAASAYRLSDGELLLLSPARVRIDSEEAGEAARAALASRDIPSLEAAWTALNQELLPEDRYANWAEEPRRRLRELSEQQLPPALARALTDSSRTDKAIHVLRSAVDRSPSDEPLHLLLARTLLDPGRPRQAIQQFHACRKYSPTNWAPVRDPMSNRCTSWPSRPSPPPGASPRRQVSNRSRSPRRSAGLRRTPSSAVTAPCPPSLHTPSP